jgi:medium-chain acyl-[acyl-carrier-protein] hydrolase
MGPLYVQNFEITDNMVDCYGRLKTSNILFIAQEIAGKHCNLLQVDYETLAQKRMFWAVTRHKVQVTRLPRRGETIRVETWPMPTTRVAYPRSVVAYDEAGNECFRSISLWVLMDLDTRSMILPGKSGISVLGTLRGTELAAPNSLVPKALNTSRSRTVCFTDLDHNGHMNNTRYLDWIDDLLPSPFHCKHTIREFTVCYLSEAREGQELQLHWDFLEENTMQVDAYRHLEEKDERVFSARISFN